MSSKKKKGDDGDGDGDDGGKGIHVHPLVIILYVTGGIYICSLLFLLFSWYRWSLMTANAPPGQAENARALLKGDYPADTFYGIDIELTRERFFEDAREILKKGQTGVDALSAQCEKSDDRASCRRTIDLVINDHNANEDQLDFFTNAYYKSLEPRHADVIE